MIRRVYDGCLPESSRLASGPEEHQMAFSSPPGGRRLPLRPDHLQSALYEDYANS